MFSWQFSMIQAFTVQWAITIEEIAVFTKIWGKSRQTGGKMVSDHDFHQSLLIFVIFGAGCLPELRKVMSRSASIFALLKLSWTNLFLSISNKICFSTLNWLLFCSNLAVFTKCSEIFVDLAIMFVENIWVFLKHVAVHAGFLNSGVSTPRHFTTFISPWSIARGPQWDRHRLVKLPTSCSLNPAYLC